jgi:hypothetical protein
MKLRERWAAIMRWYAAHKPWERYTIAGVAAAMGAYLGYVLLVEPVLGYRQALADEIVEKQEQLERGARFVAARDSLVAERDDLKKRLEREKAKLLPGDSGTLAAAALQERVTTVATQKGITVQSTQVMREEQVDPFRKVAVRLTVSGEVKPLAELLQELEYAPHQQLTIPFLEANRRGVIAGAKGPRTIAATIEVAGFVLAKGQAEPAASAEGEAAPADAAPGEGETPPAGDTAPREPAPPGDTAAEGPLPPGFVPPFVPGTGPLVPLEPAPRIPPPPIVPPALAPPPPAAALTPDPTASAHPTPGPEVQGEVKPLPAGPRPAPPPEAVEP